MQKQRIHSSLPVQSPDQSRGILYVLYFAGVAYLFFLLSSQQNNVFYSGDAGMKFMAIKQICASEDFRYITDTHARWVNDIWAQGYFPFKEPFVVPSAKGYVFLYPPAFQFISSFFYGKFGYKGLYIIPFISLLLLWYWFIRTALKLSFSTKETAAIFFLLAFCSPLSFYGVVYWEHTLAILLEFSTLYFILCKPRQPWLGAVLGIMSGLTAWLRPECMLINILLAGSLAVIDLRRLTLAHWLFAIGLSVGTASFLIFNKVEYGYFFGIHGLQVLENNSYYNKRNQASNIFRINLLLIEYFPAVLLLVPVVFAWLVYKYPLKKLTIAFIIVCLAYCLFSLYMLPNDGSVGGKQWGPRYFLPVIPIIILILADVYAQWKSMAIGIRYRRFFAISAILTFGSGFIVNTFVEAVTHYNENLNRVHPALSFVQQDPGNVIVVNAHFVTMELASTFREKDFFLAEDTATFNRLLPLLQQQGVDHFIYINEAGLPNGFAQVLSAHRVKLQNIGSYKIGIFPL
jgi:hypothetical protein